MLEKYFGTCLGGTSSEDPYGKRINPEDARRCLQKIKENQEARELARNPLQTSASESNSGLWSAPPTSMGYPNAPPMNYSFPSPPPAYSTIAQKDKK